MGWSDRWIVGGMLVLLAACSPVSNQVSMPEINVKQSLNTQQTTTLQVTKTPLHTVADSDTVQSRATRLANLPQAAGTTPIPVTNIKQVPILMYHSISDNPKNLLCLAPAKFREQMTYLRQAGYHAITAKELADWGTGKPLADKPVLITLDDGYRDNYTNAYPSLKDAGMKATIYVITGSIGSNNSLTQDMLKEMSASGVVEFGAHTVSHLDLTTLSGARLHDEIYNSKQQLEEVLGVPVTSFCYPSGRFNQSTVEAVKQAGYLSAVTTKPGEAEVAQGMLTLHRLRINGDITIEQFKHMLP